MQVVPDLCLGQQGEDSDVRFEGHSRASALHGLLQSGMSGNQLATVENVVTDQAIKTPGHLVSKVD